MRRSKKPNGFTLIELLTVVGIIGVLAAIAIPQFASYRQRGRDALANSDLRTAATGEEALFATSQAYANCTDGACETALPGFRLSDSVTLNMQVGSSGNPSFSGTSTSTQGTGRTFSYDSTLGGMQ